MSNSSPFSGPTRREFMTTCGATLIGAGCTLANHAVAANQPQTQSLTYQSATKLAKLIAERQVSAADVAEAHLKRIEEVNPKLNAIVQINPEQVRADARQCDADLRRGVSRGPLHGVPFTIKDCFLTKGVITTNGCPELRTYIPTEDATIVKRLRAAGGVFLGKTNVPEMCHHSITDNLVYGRTNNPYDLARTPDGSSGGEAAIIAAGGSPLGIGSDIGGSIRTPAHVCGLAGIKPTSGRVPETGNLGAFPPSVAGWNSAGPIARTVDDLALALRIIAGPDDLDPHALPLSLGDAANVEIDKLRVAFFTDDGVSKPTDETRQSALRAVQQLREAGATVTEICPPLFGKSVDIWVWLVMPTFTETANHLQREYARMAGSQVSKQRLFLTEWIFRWIEFLSQTGDFGPTQRVQLELELESFRRNMLVFMQGFDVIVCPVASNPAVVHPTAADFEKMKYAEFTDTLKKDGAAYCMSFNLTGWPATVVRAGTSPEGLPIGVQIAAKPWQEHLTLLAAKIIEQKPGGWRPPAGL